MSTSGPRRKNLEGLQFGKLSVVSYACNDSNGKSKWNCVCECGNATVSLGQALTGGHAKSCGCATKESVIKAHTTHNLSKTPEYKAWASMIQRCTNPNNKYWHRYGQRGISVFEKWFEFQCFIDDMGPSQPGLSLDRIDNTGNYEPGNCRWATISQQCSNKEKTVFVELNGQRRPLSEVCREYEISRPTVYGRLKRGWEIEKALTTPPKEIS